MFGPTETTVWSTVFEVSGAGVGSSVPIGRPIDNTVCRVLDRPVRLVPVGVAGELCIGGAGVARGYRNRAGAHRRAVRGRPVRRRVGGCIGRGIWPGGGRTARWSSSVGPITRSRCAGTASSSARSRPRCGPIPASPTPWSSLTVAMRPRRCAPTCIPVDADQPPTAAELRATLAARLPGYMIPNTYHPPRPLPPNPQPQDRPQRPPRTGGRRPGCPHPVRGASDRRRAGRRPHLRGSARGRAGRRRSRRSSSSAAHSLQVTSLLARLQGAFGVEVSLRVFFVDPTVAGTAAALVVDELRSPPGRACRPTPRRSRRDVA